MKLSPRLKSIVNMVPKESLVVDIGTDHGFVPVYLIENKICNYIIASDVNIGPLNIAKEYIKSKNLTEKIETRLGSGLKVLDPNEVDVAIIAGMGGILIADILEASREVAKSIPFFILQPMTASDKLREYLYDNGYSIINEKLSRESDRVYEILLVKHGQDKITDSIYYEIGKKLIEQKDPLLEFFISKKLDKINKILNNIKNNSENNEKYKDLQKKYNKILEVKNKYESEKDM